MDAGSFIGASAYCLAGGLSRNPAAAGAHARIHAYDLFVARDKYVADSITRNIRPLALGEPYLDIFQRQNAEIRV